MQAQVAHQRRTQPGVERAADARRRRAPAQPGLLDGRPAVAAQLALADRLNARPAAVVQRRIDASALEASGAGRATNLLAEALASARGASAALVGLARQSPLLDLVFVPQGGPDGQTNLHYRDDDTRVDLEQAERVDPTRARASGLTLRIGVNLAKRGSEGAVLQTLTHEIGVHAAAFAPYLDELLHGGQQDRAADDLAAALTEPGLLSGSIQHILLAGGQAQDYEELVALLGPRLGELREGFLTADRNDRAEQARWAEIMAFRIWDALGEAPIETLPLPLQAALAQLGITPPDDVPVPSSSGYPASSSSAIDDTPPPGRQAVPDFSDLFALGSAAWLTAPPPPATVEPVPLVNPTPQPSNITLPPLSGPQLGPLPSLRDLGLLDL